LYDFFKYLNKVLAQPKRENKLTEHP